MASNTYTKGYADGAALTEAELDTAYQTLQLDVSNTALMTTGSTSGQALISNGSGSAASFQTLSDPQGPFALRNYGLKATAATGVLTVSLKTKALTDPSGSDKVDFSYSTQGTTSSAYTTVQVSSAVSLAINASATLGQTATTALRIFVYGYYNTVTTSVKLAVSASSDFDNGSRSTFTAISASADSASALYASAVLSASPRLLGFVQAAHNSAGAWQTPTVVDISNNSDLTNGNTLNKVAAAIPATGANSIGSSMTATGANAIGAVMTATGANNVVNSIDSTVAANKVGALMSATGSNPLVNSIDSATAANHVLATSSIGTKVRQSGITTTNLSGSAASRAQITVVTTGLYLVHAEGSIVSTAAGFVAQVTLISTPAQVGPSINVSGGATGATTTVPFTIIGVQALSASDVVDLKGAVSAASAHFSANGVVEIIRLS